MATSTRSRKPSAAGASRAGAGRRPRSTRPATTRATIRSGATRAPEPTVSARAKLTGRAAVLLLVLAVLGVSYASSARAWLQQRSEINSLTAQIATSNAQVAELEQAKQRWHDRAYIRTQARERFGWLMPGETGYRVIDEHGHIVQSGSRLSPPKAGAARANGEWWDRAWGSLLAAGADPADSRQLRNRPAVSLGKVANYSRPRHMPPKDWLVPETARGPVGR